MPHNGNGNGHGPGGNNGHKTERDKLAKDNLEDAELPSTFVDELSTAIQATIDDFIITKTGNAPSVILCKPT